MFSYYSGYLHYHRFIQFLHFVFPQGWVERAKNERAWKSTRARKGDTRLGDFHARSRFARSTIPEEKWGTTRSLNNSPLLDGSNRKSANSFVIQNKKAFVILIPMTSIARNIGRKKKKTSTCEKPWGSFISSAVFLELEKMAETNH